MTFFIFCRERFFDIIPLSQSYDITESLPATEDKMYPGNHLREPQSWARRGASWAGKGRKAGEGKRSDHVNLPLDANVFESVGLTVPTRDPGMYYKWISMRCRVSIQYRFFFFFFSKVKNNDKRNKASVLGLKKKRSVSDQIEAAPVNTFWLSWS